MLESEIKIWENKRYLTQDGNVVSICHLGVGVTTGKNKYFCTDEKYHVADDFVREVGDTESISANNVDSFDVAVQDLVLAAEEVAKAMRLFSRAAGKINIRKP